MTNSYLRLARALTVAAMAAFATVPSFAEGPGDRSDATEAIYREGLDFSQPALELFRDWPPDSLVDRPYWLPWSAQGFQRAALFGRPVFFVLSVNWSRPSNEWLETTLGDPEVLRTVNRSYVSVRVNADLRPDIRERYQTGTWPTAAFLLPNGKPMLSQANDLGVAKPITTSNVDKKALLFLLEQGEIYWNRRMSLLMEVGDYWTEREGPEPPSPGAVTAGASDVMARWMVGNADPVDGGFGLAPKYLVQGLQQFAALRSARGQNDVRGHARLTLERLASSPLFDAKDGGIHRLAAAPEYGAVQTEKMLEGNASFIAQLVLALRDQPSDELRQALVQTVEFVTEVLARPEGGYHLAQVAAEEGQANPPVDRVVLSGPNALAGAALIRAGLLLDDSDVVAAGRRALNFVHDEAYRPGRGVRHVLEPAPDSRVYLETQADVAFGFVDAFETTGDLRYLDAAERIVEFAWRNLKDPGEARLRDHLPDRMSIGLLANERRPLGPNVRIARTMIRLAALGRGQAHHDRALSILAPFCGDLSSFGVHGIEAALAIEEAITPPLRIEIVGPADETPTWRLRRAAANTSWPWVAVRTGRPLEWAEARVGRDNARESVRTPRELEQLILSVAGARTTEANE